MEGFNRISLAIEEALDLHEAARVIGDDVVGSGFYNRAAFDLTHGGTRVRGGDNDIRVLKMIEIFSATARASSQ